MNMDTDIIGIIDAIKGDSVRNLFRMKNNYGKYYAA